MFDIFCQAGILLGPLIGLVLAAIDFRVTAAVFAVLTVAQLWRSLKHSIDPAPEKRPSSTTGG
ncbi:hypothetical protein MGAST_01925 [Mycobacterium gastri 'Wayne']|uniref:Uncharacterized protein n=1 Tax=Mycobacterium gastri TaxID=1777 RepID=A0A1X1VCH8_MYCGS|nr:hypothetical protein MGAST_01925 [Mycobacterium gastri 'Wayne']ORV66777.1 hypothetical protein AWC07_09930 [Mycobacterium gastri]